MQLRHTCLALTLGSLLTTGAYAADDSGTTLDEVMVTGSFIRRSEGFVPASPVAEIAKEDLEAHAPKTVADFLTTLPYSFNSTFTVGRALGSSNGSGSINLRNLGADATLVLLNSRRVARDAVTVSNVDVNSLVPQIAIERVEILKDGASSIYGSEAVGGVANFLTRSKFSGFEVNLQADERMATSSTDGRLSMIWGAQTDKTSVIIAAERFTRSPYTWETFGIIKSRAGTTDGRFLSGNGWPARYAVPNRNATGTLLTTSTTVADPLCAQFSAANIASGSVTRPGDTTAYPSTCQEDLPWGTSANASEKRYQAYAELHHDFGKSARFFGELGLLRTRTALADAPGAGINPGLGQPNVVIPGYAPGNTFRAVTAGGVPLFAQSSGITLGYTKPGITGNVVLPARNAAGAVLLNAGPDGIVGTADDSIGGVPFWEDVSVVAGSRELGLNCNLPGNPATTINCHSTLVQTRYNVDDFRSVLGFEGDLWRDWHYQASYTFSSNSENDTTLGAAFSMPALRAALSGFGGAGCLTPSLDPLQAGTIRPGAGACQFFNMFGNSVVATPGTSQTNTVDMVNYISAQDWAHFTAETGVVDAVVSGTVAQLPAGPLGLAIGVQQRKEAWSADYPALQNQGQSDLQAAFYDKDVTQTSNAEFLEVNAPLFRSGERGSLEFSGAVRHEGTQGSPFSSTNPKYGLLYATAGGLLKLRGTWSSSFLAPSLYQRYRQNALFTNNVVDGLNPTAPAQGRVTTLVTGNANLAPQTSKNYNLGFTVAPLDMLSVDLDYWHFNFDNAITLENGLVVARDAVLTRDPTKVVRNTAGTITQLNLTYVNNSSLVTAGIDLGVNLRTSLGRFGTLRNSLQATDQLTYQVNGVDRKGSRNGTVTGASFSVPLRATLRTVWALGNNSLESLIRYSDGFTNDVAGNAATTAKPEVESYTSWDLSYSYAFQTESHGLKNSSIGVGVNNVFDRDPPWVPDANHTLSSMYDYSGRHVWLRLKAQF